MKITNLTEKDYETVLKTVKEISEASKESDKKAIKNGELLKYIIEIFDKNNILIEIKEFYTKVCISSLEISHDMNLVSINHKVRGPFPLIDGALVDSKINRWELEKDKSKKDEIIIKNHFSEEKNKDYKYGYIVYEDVMGLKKFIELKFTYKALSMPTIEKILNSSKYKYKRFITRIKIVDGSIIEYNENISSSRSSHPIED